MHVSVAAVEVDLRGRLTVGGPVVVRLLVAVLLVAVSSLERPAKPVDVSEVKRQKARRGERRAYIRCSKEETSDGLPLALTLVRFRLTR